MKTNHLRACALVLLFLLPPSLAAGAESDEKAKSVATGLRITTSVRALGMGGTGTAHAGDPTNVSLNPAAIVGLNHISASVAKLEGIDRSEVTNLQFSGAFSIANLRTALALGYTSRNINDVTTIVGDTTFTSYRENDQVYGSLAAAFRLWVFNVSAGGTYKQLRIRDDELRIKEDVEAYDIGAIAWIPIKLGNFNTITASAGASRLNNGESDLFEVPTSNRYGFRIRYETWSYNPLPDMISPETPFFALSINSDTIEPEYQDQPWEHGLGIELSVASVAHFRIGFRDSNEREEQVQTVGLGLGVRTESIAIRFDGAWAEETKGAAGFIVGFIF